MDRNKNDSDEEPTEYLPRPWIVLNTTYDVEAWIDNYNRDLQRAVQDKNVRGCGICFGLAHGGEIFMHTTSDGDVLLDVTPDAEWVAPVITAVTQIDAPAGRIWALPGDTLTQLVLGLSSLIATTRLILNHDFKMKNFS